MHIYLLTISVLEAPHAKPVSGVEPLLRGRLQVRTPREPRVLDVEAENEPWWLMRPAAATRRVCAPARKRTLEFTLENGGHL